MEILEGDVWWPLPDLNLSRFAGVNRGPDKR
jgi:hypothetical protein